MIHSIQRSLLATSLLTVFSLAYTQTAMADTEDDLDSLLELDFSQLLDLNVSVGSYFTQSKLSSGSTTELFAREDWEKTGAKNVWDAINHQPGLFTPTNTLADKTLSIRGIAINPGTRGVATLLDGIPINNLTYSTGLYFFDNPGLGILDKIEMIRGPGSALYGADAFQGVISFSTPKYSEDVLEVEAAAGDSNYFRQSAKIAKRLNDKITLNVAIDRSNVDEVLSIEYGLGSGTLDANRTEVLKYKEPARTASLASTLGTQITDDLHVETSVILNRSSRNNARRAISGTASAISQESDFVLYKVGAEYQLPWDISLHSKLYHWNGSSSWGFASVEVPPSYFVKIDNGATGADAYIKQKNEQFNTDWVLGYTYSTSKVNEAARGAPPVPDPTDGYKRELNSQYLDVRTSFFDEKLDILYGARLDNYSDFGRHLSPRFGAIYYPDTTSAVKLLYGNAFRSPATAEIGANPPAGIQSAFGNPNIIPEIIDTYELVYMKSGANYSYEATLFYTQLEDGIVLASMPESDSRFIAGNDHLIYSNLTEAEAVGIEGKYGFVKGKLKTDLSASYVKGKDTRSNLDYDVFPDWIFNAILTYDIEEYDTTVTLSNRVELGKKTFQRSSLSELSSDLKDYYRADVNITKNYNDKLDISLNILNLFNNKDLYAGTVHPTETLRNQPGISAFGRIRYSF